MTDLIDNFLREHTLTLMLDYYSGEKQVRMAKTRGKTTCSIILPPGTELLEAAGCTSISMYRLGSFVADNELRLMRLARSLLGGRSLVRGLGLLNMTIAKPYLDKMAEEGILGGLWKNYREYIKSSDDNNFPMDACFGTRVYYGALMKHYKNIDFSIGYGTRCGWFTKFFQDCAGATPLTFLDIPQEINEESLPYQISEVRRVIKEIEQFTKRPFSEEALRDEIKLHNSISRNYLEILKIWAQDITALDPRAFIYVLSMIHFGYPDRLGRGSKYFDRLMMNLAKELKRDSKKDLSDVPKILHAPMFGGFEPEIMTITSNLGGRLLFADWVSLGVLDPIKETGDPIENYSKYLINVAEHWLDNNTVIKHWVKIVEDLKLDGVIFNSVYGCKSFTPAYKLFKDRLIELGVPIVDISFHNMNENLGQIETRIGAFIEMIKD
ncbi:MAG: 2-hydroxyacyl-CoA dehydratase [Candidatus Helarchaeota archaeon]